MPITSESAIQPIIAAVERVLEESTPRLGALIGASVRVRPFEPIAERVYGAPHYLIEMHTPILRLFGHPILWRWYFVCGIGGDMFSGAGITGPLRVSIHGNWLRNPRFSFFFQRLFLDLRGATGLDLEVDLS